MQMSRRAAQGIRRMGAPLTHSIGTRTPAVHMAAATRSTTGSIAASLSVDAISAGRLGRVLRGSGRRIVAASRDAPHMRAELRVAAQTGRVASEGRPWLAFLSPGSHLKPIYDWR